jgi:hypothetical protein
MPYHAATGDPHLGGDQAVGQYGGQVGVAGDGPAEELAVRVLAGGGNTRPL